VEHDWVAQLERDDVALPAEEKGTGVSGSGILIADGGFALGTRRQLAASVAGKRGELSAGARTGSRVGRCREGGGTQRAAPGEGWSRGFVPSKVKYGSARNESNGSYQRQKQGCTQRGAGEHPREHKRLPPVKSPQIRGRDTVPRLRGKTQEGCAAISGN